MSISTGTGDNGSTEIIGGKRLAKDHPLVECLGTIDELNAFLGDAKAADATDTPRKNQQRIEKIQKELFAIAGIIAGSAARLPEAGNLDALIAAVAESEAQLPPLNGFSVPGACAVSAKLHIARSVCRRAERRLIGMGCPETISADEYSRLLAWFNRLSDLLFLMAREEDERPVAIS